MSPPAGQTSTGHAAGQRPHQRPVAAVGDHEVAARHRLGVGHPRHEHGVGRRRARRAEIAITRTGSSASPSRHASSSRCEGSCDVEVATSTTGPSPVDRRRRPARPAPTSAARPPASTTATRADTRAAGTSRPWSATARAPCGVHGSGPSPSRARQSLYSRRPCSSPISTSPVGLPPERPPDPRARQPRADRERREARRQVGHDVRDERRHRARPRARRRAPARASGCPRRRRRARTTRTNSRVDARRHAPPPRTASAAARAWGRPGTRARPRTSSRRPRPARASVCHVSIPTSCPRATSSAPSASTGNAWPGSPNAPSRTLTPGPARTPRPSARPTGARRGARRAPTRARRRSARRARPRASTALAHEAARDHLGLGARRAARRRSPRASATGARTGSRDGRRLERRTLGGAGNRLQVGLPERDRGDDPTPSSTTRAQRSGARKLSAQPGGDVGRLPARRAPTRR